MMFDRDRIFYVFWTVFVKKLIFLQSIDLYKNGDSSEGCYEESCVCLSEF